MSAKITYQMAQWPTTTVIQRDGRFFGHISTSRIENDPLMTLAFGEGIVIPVRGNGSRFDAIVQDAAKLTLA